MLVRSNSDSDFFKEKEYINTIYGNLNKLNVQQRRNNFRRCTTRQKTQGSI
jgi:hypothetical protein